MLLMHCVHAYRIALAAFWAAVSFPVAAAEIRVNPPESATIPGDPYVLTLEIVPDEGAIPLAPDTASLDLPEGVSLAWGPLKAVQAAEGVRYTQRLEITGEVIGDYAISGLAYRFVQVPEGPALTGEKLETEERSYTLSIEDLTVPVVRDLRPYLIGGASVLGLLAVFGLLIWATRKRPEEDAAPGGTPAEQAQARLHQARQHRLDGDFYKLYLAYAEAAKILSACVEDAPQPAPLQQRAQEVGYRNERPSDDEMDGITSDLERALTRLKEIG